MINHFLIDNFVDEKIKRISQQSKFYSSSNTDNSEKQFNNENSGFIV